MTSVPTTDVLGPAPRESRRWCLADVTQMYSGLGAGRRQLVLSVYFKENGTVSKAVLGAPHAVAVFLASSHLLNLIFE